MARLPRFKFFKRFWKRKQKPKKTQFLIPNERAIYKKAKETKWTDPSKLRKNYPARQRIVPVSKGLSEKLGIEKNSKIHFFAGGYGNWAKALARDNKVRYSDASRKLVKNLKKYTKAKGLQSIRTLEGSQWPRKRKKFDWSISFEPIPMTGAPLTLALSRSLLNNKGAKLIYGEYPAITPYYNKALKTARQVEKAYGAECTEKKNIKNIDERARKIDIITLLTNEKARKKAWVDLQILKATRAKHGEKPKKATVKELFQSRRVQKLGLTKKQVIQSLKRLEKLGKIGGSERIEIKKK